MPFPRLQLVLVHDENAVVTARDELHDFLSAQTIRGREAKREELRLPDVIVLRAGGRTVERPLTTGISAGLVLPGDRRRRTCQCGLCGPFAQVRCGETELMVSMVSPSDRWRPVAVAALGATSISAAAVLITIAHVGPATAAFYRCALPLPVLAALALAEQRRHGPRTPRSRAGAALAGLFLGLNLVLWIHSIPDLGAGAATVLGNLQVLFVLAFSWAIWHERPRRSYLVALPVVLIGVIMVSGMIGRGGTGIDPGAGVAYGLGTSAAYACVLLILRQTAESRVHTAGQLFDATAGAALGALLLGAAFGGLQLTVSWHSLAWLLVLSVTSGIVGWLLITWSLPRLPAPVSALVLLLEPAAALLLAAIVLHQRPSALQLLGAALICGVVVTATRPVSP